MLKFNRFKILMLLGLSSMLLTSCGDINDVVSGLSSTIRARVDWNQEQLARLKNVGLISDGMYNAVVKEMDSRVSKLTNLDNSNINDDFKDLVKNSLGYAIISKGEPYSNLTSSVSDDTPIFKAYVKNIGEVSKFIGGVDNRNDTNASVIPIDILSAKDDGSNDIGSRMNNLLKTKIYVLNSNLTGSDLSDVAIAMNTIKELKDKSALTDEDKDKLAKARSHLSKFTESNLSLLGDNESLSRITVPNDKAYRAATGNSIPKDTNEANINNPSDGKDLAIFSDTVPVMALRLREVDSKIVDKLVSDIQNNQDSYLIDYIDGDHNKGARVYKMDYPISYVNSLYDDNTGNVNFTVATSNSIRVNIMTGKIVLKNPSDMYNSSELSSIEPIYNVLGNSDNESSFAIWNKTTIKEKNASGKEVDINCNSILLKDYLEYTYLPDFMAKEVFVSLGRKVRLYGLNSDNTFKDNSAIAKFVDKNGNIIDGASPIAISDIIDKSSGVGDKLKTAVKLQGLIKSDNTNTSSNLTTSSSSSLTPEYRGGTWSSYGSSWKYTTAGSKELKSGWAWIDQNNDGEANCFYFRNSLLVVSEDISDGGSAYTVDENGYWVVDGVIQSKTLSQTTEAINDNTTSITSSTSTGLVTDQVKNKFEQVELRANIFPVVEFPIDGDNSIAGTDGKDNGTSKSRLIHYGIFIDTNIYKSQLFSGWLNIDGDASGGSLNWWNNWLGKAKFIYRIDKRALEEYLKVYFDFGNSKTDNNIILDSETIRDIQINLHKQKRVETVTLYRTLFVILGIVCIVYGVLLIGAWAIDVMTMLDLKFLPILTLGKCVAVIDKIEYGSSNVIYMTFSKIIIRMCSLFILGLLLINIDVLGMSYKIYSLFSDLTEFIKRGLFGS